ncbi:hypothetical protein Tco_0373214 [Tanacetum coccineum]
MGMQPPQVVVNGVLNSLLKALFCRGSLTRVIVAAKIGDMNLTFGEWNDASSESVSVADRQVFSKYNIDFSTLSFGRKRKTTYGFEMDSRTLCVSKKGNLGDRKTFCISSEANGQSRHSKASLNITQRMKLLFQCVRMLWNDASRLIATCSDYIDNSRHISCTSSNINCPRKEAAAHQHLMDHVCVQPEKAFVISECPLQKKVVDKVNCSKKQQAQANDQKICMVQTDVVKAKEGSKGTMEWAKEKMKKGYEATKVRAVKGLEAEKERSDAALDKFYSKIESHPSELQQQAKGMLKAKEEDAAKILARAQEYCDEHKESILKPALGGIELGSLVKQSFMI